jgi:hypothetical protein
VIRRAGVEELEQCRCGFGESVAVRCNFLADGLHYVGSGVGVCLCRRSGVSDTGTETDLVGVRVGRERLTTVPDIFEPVDRSLEVVLQQSCAVV